MDADADPVDLTGAFVIQIENDVPIASGDTETALVQEDDIHNLQSDGNDEDGSLLDSEATVTGTLSGVVSEGADEPVTFSWAGALDGTTASFTSKGDTVTYTVAAGVLTATADGVVSGDGPRTVFTLTLQSNGDYTLDLNDQVDHDPASGDAGILEIDLSGSVVAVDADADPVDLTGAFVIQIENDVPIASGDTETALVQEDDIHNLQSDGNDEDGSLLDSEATVTGTLSGVVSEGADEPVTFSWAGALDGTTASFTSKGDTVTYTVAAGVLTATADGVVSGDGPRTVFTLTLQSNGDYTLDLDDQVDHDPASGDAGILEIDLSGSVVAVDADADPVDLTGAFVIQIENDVPIASGDTETALVQEDDIHNLQSDGNDEDGSLLDSEATVTGTLSGVVSEGADEPVTFSWAGALDGTTASFTSKGDTVTYTVAAGVLTATADGVVSGDGPRTVFTLTLQSNGDYTLDLEDQVDHDPASGDAGILEIDLSGSVVAVDADADPVDLTGAFVIQIENDVPIASGDTETALVQEDDIHNLQSDGNDEDGSLLDSEATVTGTLSGVVSEGADEPVTFSWAGALDGTTASFTSKGDTVTYSVAGGVLTATADGVVSGDGPRTVFTLTLQSNGDYTLDLDDQVDHDPASGDAGFSRLTCRARLLRWTRTRIRSI